MLPGASSQFEAGSSNYAGRYAGRGVDHGSPAELWRATRLSRPARPVSDQRHFVALSYTLSRDTTQSGWFEDTPLKGGTEEGCPLKEVHEGTFLIEARQPAWNHSRASGLTVVLPLGLLCGVGSGTPPQDVLSSHSTPERQSLFESHRQRRWLTRWS